MKAHALSREEWIVLRSIPRRAAYAPVFASSTEAELFARAIGRAEEFQNHTADEAQQFEVAEQVRQFCTHGAINPGHRYELAFSECPASDYPVHQLYESYLAWCRLQRKTRDLFAEVSTERSVQWAS